MSRPSTSTYESTFNFLDLSKLLNLQARFSPQSLPNLGVEGVYYITESINSNDLDGLRGYLAGQPNFKQSLEDPGSDDFWIYNLNTVLNLKNFEMGKYLFLELGVLDNYFKKNQEKFAEFIVRCVFGLNDKFPDLSIQMGKKLGVSIAGLELGEYNATVLHSVSDSEDYGKFAGQIIQNDDGPSLSKATKDGITSLHIAMGSGGFYAATSMMVKMENKFVDLLKQQDCFGNTPLHLLFDNVLKKKPEFKNFIKTLVLLQKDNVSKVLDIRNKKGVAVGDLICELKQSDPEIDSMLKEIDVSKYQVRSSDNGVFIFGDTYRILEKGGEFISQFPSKVRLVNERKPGYQNLTAVELAIKDNKMGINNIAALFKDEDIKKYYQDNENEWLSLLRFAIENKKEEIAKLMISSQYGSGELEVSGVASSSSNASSGVFSPHVMSMFFDPEYKRSNKDPIACSIVKNGYISIFQDIASRSEVKEFLRSNSGAYLAEILNVAMSNFGRDDEFINPIIELGNNLGIDVLNAPLTGGVGSLLHLYCTTTGVVKNRDSMRQDESNIKFLLRKGADISITNRDQRNPLHTVIDNGATKATSIILDELNKDVKKAKVVLDQKTIDGYKPFHILLNKIIHHDKSSAPLRKIIDDKKTPNSDKRVLKEQLDSLDKIKKEMVELVQKIMKIKDGNKIIALDDESRKIIEDSGLEWLKEETIDKDIRTSSPEVSSEKDGDQVESPNDDKPVEEETSSSITNVVRSESPVLSKKVEEKKQDDDQKPSLKQDIADYYLFTRRRLIREINSLQNDEGLENSDPRAKDWIEFEIGRKNQEINQVDADIALLHANDCILNEGILVFRDVDEKLKITPVVSFEVLNDARKELDEKGVLHIAFLHHLRNIGVSNGLNIAMDDLERLPEDRCQDERRDWNTDFWKIQARKVEEIDSQNGSIYPRFYCAIGALAMGSNQLKEEFIRVFNEDKERPVNSPRSNPSPTSGSPAKDKSTRCFTT